MNAEIVTALETYYPEEPSLDEVIDRIHMAIHWAKNASRVPYRKPLIEALEQFSEQLANGLELDQYEPPMIGQPYRGVQDVVNRRDRLKRAQKFGVETDDFRMELERGMFSNLPGDRMQMFLGWIKEGRGDEVLQQLKLGETKFVDKPAAIAVLRDHFDRVFRENWGDPDADWKWDDDF